MIGLMKKDFYNVGSSLKIYFLIPLLFAIDFVFFTPLVGI